MALTRLDKYLADRTPHSRSEVRALLRQGLVCVDGQCVRDGALRLDPDVQTVTLSGTPVQGGAHRYLVLHKPQGCVCATQDRTLPTVIDLVPQALRVKGLFPAGRLDADTTGLVLLTDDGALAHRMLSPRHHVPKYYLVRLARPHSLNDTCRFEEGITLSDGTQCLPARVWFPGDRAAVLCLHEGKYHQVKRMFAALGNHVEGLHRAAVGGYVLPPAIEPGGCLEILHKDVEKMLESAPPEGIYERIMTDFSSYWINEGHEV